MHMSRLQEVERRYLQLMQRRTFTEAIDFLIYTFQEPSTPSSERQRLHPETPEPEGPP